MNRLPVALKAAIAFAGFLFLSSFAQFALIRWSLRAETRYLESQGVRVGRGTPIVERVRPKLVLAVWLPQLLSSIGSGVIFGAMIRRRADTLVAALRGIARGELKTTRLPPPPGPDFAAVRDAFESMRDALDRAVTKLAEADAQRRRLFADLAHDLASPTSAILGITDALARPSLCPRPEDRARLVAMLEDETIRLERLVADVRDLAHLDDPDVSFRRDPTDVAAVAARAARRVADGAGDLHARVETDLAPAWAAADAVRIDQALANLLTNALRYTPPSGTIALTAASDGDRVRLTVEDSGPGVPDELLPRLTDRLWRADPSRDRRTGGHGLGLAIVRAIVDRHEGDVRFSRSARLGGLRVDVTLPRVPAPAG